MGGGIANRAGVLMMSEPEDSQTEQPQKAGTSFSRLQWWAYSVPLFIKILGIVVLISAIFGLVVYFQMRASISRLHDQMHIQSANRAAVSLAHKLERLDLAKDTSLVERALGEILETFPDVSYVLVLDAEERILAHHFSFPTEIPAELPSKADELCGTCHHVPQVVDIPSDNLGMAAVPPIEGNETRRFSREMGTILEAKALIAGGEAGSVRVGHGDSSIQREMSIISSALLRSLIICLVIGQAIALLLTYLLINPVVSLVQATNAIAAGDFSSRAKVYSSDEIGRLARVFNLMAGKLQDYQREVQEKEAFRVSLIDRIVQAQEEERISVARELHDQLGQSLYRILLSYQDIRRDCAPQDPRHDELQEAIREVIDDVRRLAWDIRPSILDDFGLDSALQQYVKETSDHAGLRIDYKCGFPPDAPRLPNRIEVVLYRIAQEAITNVVRHAKAKRASVILLRRDSEVTLFVEDDGQGFKVESVLEGGISSLGLMGMKERVELAGGTLTIHSEPEKGAAIRARIPVTERS